MTNGSSCGKLPPYLISLYELMKYITETTLTIAGNPHSNYHDTWECEFPAQAKQLAEQKYAAWAHDRSSEIHVEVFTQVEFEDIKLDHLAGEKED